MSLRPRALLAGAAACAVAFVAILLVAYGSEKARIVDAAALEGFVGLQRPAIDRATDLAIRLGDPVPVLVGAILLAGIALARGRPRSALFVAALVGLTSVSSQLLKVVLAYPRADSTVASAAIGDAAFPSGHTTGVMSLAIALVVVMPPRLRAPAALVGGASAIAVSYSLVTNGGHFPSDILGGYLLAIGTALGLLAVLRAAAARYPERAGRLATRGVARRSVEAGAALGLTVTLAVGTAALCLVAASVLLDRRGDLIDYAQTHTVFFAVASTLAVCALALLAGLALAVGRRG